MMDSREYFHAMMAWREMSRSKSREQYEVVRFQEYLQQLANPYMKRKPEMVEDVIKFKWELEAKQPLEQMKQVLQTIASTNFAKKEPPVRTSPPVSMQPKMKRTKYYKKKRR